MRYVVFPGYGDSDTGHWQTLWQAELRCARVQPMSWTEPTLNDWVAALDRVIEPGMVVLAHSLGCLATIAWLERHPDVAAAAFLVAVPDAEGPDFPASISGFARPTRRLAQPVFMIGSGDDPYAGSAFTRATAEAIGAPLVELGAAGHLNTASGRGPWPEGRRLLADFVASLPG